MKNLNLDGKNILITGGAGFIGANIALFLEHYYPQANVVVFDKFRTDETFPSGNPTSLGHFKNLINFHGEIIVGDLMDAAALAKIAARKWDYILHQGAISDTTAMDQMLVMDCNFGSFNFFVELAKRDKARLIYASSAGTYGNSPAPNIVGKGEAPENVYGFSKLNMDKFVRRLGEPANIVGLRYFNVYGGGEFYKGKTASMVLQLGIQAINNGVVRLFKHGEQKRDFVYIKDVVAANICAMGAEVGGIFNVGSGVARSYNDIVECLRNALLKDFRVEYIDNPYKFFQNHTEADIAPTREKLGYSPEYTLEKGVSEYADEILKRAEESK